jgi:F420-dependent oxidoreductase-like protein
VRIGIHYANFTHPDWQHQLRDRLTETARVADQGGAALLTVMDHYFQMEQMGGPPEPMLEGYTTLGYLAGQTENVRLSLLVTGTTYRHPGLLAKIVTTLDVLSGGRAMLGLGAAWYDREHAALGVPFPPTAERFERMEETLQIVRQMWSDDNGPYDGRHYRLAETWCVPQPVQQPHPPILIGGGGERKTLRLVAQYADACNIFPEGTDGVRHKLDVLRRHCDDAGTDFDRIERTCAFAFTADDGGPVTAQLIDQLRWLAGLGVETVIGRVEGNDPRPAIELLGRHVVPAAAELAATPPKGAQS